MQGGPSGREKLVESCLVGCYCSCPNFMSTKPFPRPCGPPCSRVLCVASNFLYNNLVILILHRKNGQMCLQSESNNGCNSLRPRLGCGRKSLQPGCWNGSLGASGVFRVHPYWQLVHLSYCGKQKEAFLSSTLLKNAR